MGHLQKMKTLQAATCSPPECVRKYSRSREMSPVACEKHGEEERPAIVWGGQCEHGLRPAGFIFQGRGVCFSGVRRDGVSSLPPGSRADRGDFFGMLDRSERNRSGKGRSQSVRGHGPGVCELFRGSQMGNAAAGGPSVMHCLGAFQDQGPGGPWGVGS